ncbi:TIGR02234 family membrane protein [Nocardia nova]|uniref:TIGR02234 family membrane protein n=1 Tax=Nocardia nova TaxID=37330 RepID=UPI000CE9EFA1|nr:TIGR02234 family membrane protein [Nocardia nova]PPJ26107.1 TIGR02234 family membrane protein [Nocardia nova]
MSSPDPDSAERHSANEPAGKSTPGAPIPSVPEAEIPSVPEADTSGDSEGTSVKRARPVLPVLLLAVGAAALWGSSRMTWVTLRSSDGLTEPRTQHLNGGLWFGALTPLALVLLASIAAVFATKGWLRRLIGVVVALVAAVAAVPGLALLTQHGKIAERAARLAELPARAHVDAATAATFPAALSVVGALAAFAAGVLLARMPETTARMSGKYDNPVFRRAAAAEHVAEVRRTGDAELRRTGDTESATEATDAPRTATPKSSPHTPEPESGELSQRVLWDALDAGADPTDDEPGR